MCLPRFNDEVKHIKVVEKDNWIHITEAKKFDSLLVGDSRLQPAPIPSHRGQVLPPGPEQVAMFPMRIDSSQCGKDVGNWFLRH